MGKEQTGALHELRRIQASHLGQHGFWAGSQFPTVQQLASGLPGEARTEARPGNVFLKTFPQDSLIWQFSEAKVKF